MTLKKTNNYWFVYSQPSENQVTTTYKFQLWAFNYFAVHLESIDYLTVLFENGFYPFNIIIKDK